MRVHIVGLPSSGKTTLAKALSARLNVPHHDLDEVAFLDEAWSPRPALERGRLVAEILASPDWVTEGNFLGWATPFLATADHVIWLDPSLPRLLFRHIRRHRRRQPRWLLARLRFQVRSYRRAAGSGPATNDPNLTRSGVELALRPWAKKVLKARHPVTASDVIEMLNLPGTEAGFPARHQPRRSCTHPQRTEAESTGPQPHRRPAR
jgi:hypothetical protein